MSVNLECIADDVSRGRHSSVSNNMNNNDIAAVWDAVASYVERQLLQRKGVSIKNLGTFTLAITRIDIGNNQFVQTTRPVFIPSATFLQTNGLTSSHKPTNDAPVSSINFTALAFETPYSRDVVERCLYEVVALLQNNIRSGKVVDFLFKGIGRLLVGDGRVKMRFFKEFINNFDKSGSLVRNLRGRPNTIDSVMSDSAAMVRSTSVNSALGHRDGTSVEPNGSLQPIPEYMPEEAPEGIPPPFPAPGQPNHNHDGCSCSCHQHGLIDHVTAGQEAGDYASDPQQVNDNEEINIDAIKAEAAEDLRRRGRSSVMDGAIPTAGIVDFSVVKENLRRPTSSQPICSSCAVGDCNSASLRPQKPPRLLRSQTMDDLASRPIPSPLSHRPDSCIHSLGGQELCYVCYQRSKLNQPLDLKNLRKQREVEEDKMWGEQNKLDALRFKQEQDDRNAKQQLEAEKVAAFNLGIAEAVRASKQAHKQPEQCPSYILKNRSETPIRATEVVELKNDCKRQADERKREEARRKQEEYVSGQIEQLELRKALLEEREKRERQRQKHLAQYKASLDEQIRNRESPIPARQPDSEEPIFGALDGANGPERKQAAVDIAHDQLDTVAARKRAEVLRRIQQQREEQSALKRACHDLNSERSEQFRRAYEARRCLENEWLEATKQKKERERGQKLRFSQPGLLIHEQCDSYKRCSMCQRKCSNNGKSHVWTETYFKNGSRYIV